VPPTPDAPTGPGAILLRALLYAGALTLLVLYGPGDGARFIYVGF
jgi:hypothetical protein